MKQLLIYILFLTLSASAFAQNMEGMKGMKKQTAPGQSEYYTCVMHPEIHEAHPGNALNAVWR